MPVKIEIMFQPELNIAHRTERPPGRKTRPFSNTCYSRSIHYSFIYDSEDVCMTSKLISGKSQSMSCFKKKKISLARLP